MLFIVLLTVLIICIALYCYWRFFFFYRNPDRDIPEGKNIVSPAEGTIVYVKMIEGDDALISIKKKRPIQLEEIFKYRPESTRPAYLIGIFMHPTSVHVNRAPIEGTVEKIVYTKAKNLPMTLMWWRVLFGLKPYEYRSSHVIQNERNTILFHGDIPVFITQIADIYVNKIECWVVEGQKVKKGERIGMIKMGSQVDMFFPAEAVTGISVKIGQKVIAGSSIIASLR